MKSPVLFLIFKREDTTRKVFERLREVKPSKLYIAADGPRPNRPDEVEKCMATRRIVDNIDWPCEVHKLFHDQNLGCGLGVSTAITWFFEQEEEGIIIEDDIMAHPDFFSYCDEMLEKYRNDERIQLITGRNPFFGGIKHDTTYYMSSNFHIWGWASWRRVWSTYQFDASKLSKADFMRELALRLPSKCHAYYSNIFDMMAEHRCDTWDYQLFFNQILNKRYSLVPYINLTENIGMGSADAAHTTAEDKTISRHKAYSPYPLVHPVQFKEDKDADLVFIKKSGLYEKSSLERFLKKVRRKVEKLFG